MGAFDDLVPGGAKQGAFDDLVPQGEGRVVATTDDGGRIVERPDGSQIFTSPGYATSDPAQVKRILSGTKPADVSRTGPVSTDGNTARQVFQGATMGGGDEITAYLTSLFGGNSYDTELDRERARVSEGRREAPISSLAANIGGAIMPGSLIAKGVQGGLQGAGLLAQAPGLLARMGIGATAGGIEGLATGFNSGEGGASERMDSAGDAGLIGAIFGGAAPAVTAVAAPIMRGAYSLATAPFAKGANETAASRIVLRALNRAETTADDVDAAIKAAADDGQDMFTVADALGPSGRSALNGATRLPGAAKTESVDFLTQRQAGQGERLSAALSDALGASDTAAQRVDALTTARGAAADTAYEAARNGAGPVDVRPVLSAIDDRIGGMQGSGIAGDAIDGRLASYRSRLAASPSALPPGVTARELSDFDRVLGLKQQISDDIGAAVRAGRNNEARELGKVLSAIDAQLETASPAYRAANDQFAMASRVIDAVGEGSAAAAPRVRAQDTLDQFGAMTPDQQTAFRTGYADPVLAAIENARPGANKVPPLQSTKRATELSALAEDPETLMRIIDREGTMFTTGNRVLGGSATADNLADSADNALGGAHLLGEAVVTPQYALRRALGAAANFVVNGATGQNEATRALLARSLLGNDIGAAIAPAQRAQQVSDAYSALLGALTRSGSIRGEVNGGK